MSNNNISVLVNGHACKQYTHDGKIFIEAKDGSEYEIKIKNPHWFRVMAVVTVDGLNVISGKEDLDNGGGYIISGNSSLTIKGFRHSNESVGAFKFTNKNSSYTKEQGNGTANVGVIGILLYNEQTTYGYGFTYPNTNQWTYNNTSTYPNATPVKLETFVRSNNIGISGSAGITPTAYSLNAGNTLRSANFSTDNNSSLGYASYCASITPTTDANFDLGTTWGQNKESKVKEVEFEKGFLISTSSIYYASREQLLIMGVPLDSAIPVAFPNAFPNKFATPPKNWVGK